MKRQFKTIVSIVMILLTTAVLAQDGSVRTVFKKGVTNSGGYGALTNKFTTIRGKFTNMSGIYGGWFINHRFMVGAGASAMTNNLRVPVQYRADPLRDLSYEYGQVGLVTEYVIGSDKPIHLAFSLFSGAGFTLQYERYGWHSGNDPEDIRDENWFFVAEPGVQLEVNLFKWMRLSPGISYRKSFGSDGLGLKDKDISNISYNATLKFGKF
ncbi:MAG: hypothetical protein ABIR18_12950 [Chitinophagaceae bacterium]